MCMYVFVYLYVKSYSFTASIFKYHNESAQNIYRVQSSKREETHTKNEPMEKREKEEEKYLRKNEVIFIL